MTENNLTNDDKVQYWKDLYLKEKEEAEKLSEEHFQVCLFRNLLIDDNIKKSEIIRDKNRIINNLEKDLQTLQLQGSREVNNGK